MLYDTSKAKGSVPMVYIAMARGSPWVVPSQEKIVYPLVDKSTSID